MKERVLAILGGSALVGLFRYLNRNKVLILAYHGVSRGNYAVPPYTQIPRGAFADQIRYVSEHYSILPLRRVVEALRRRDPLPANTAVVTFDDGYRNNATEAFPILREHGAASTIFLTADYVGTDRALPFDRCWIILDELHRRSAAAEPHAAYGTIDCRTADAFRDSYRRLSAFLKDLPTQDQHRCLDALSRQSGIDEDGSPHRGDFTLLSWREVGDLSASGLVDFGSHTLSHEILGRIPREESVRQIRESKERIRERAGTDVDLFAYPNGEPGDFDGDHARCLAETGYLAGVTTLPRLNRRDADPFSLGRMCVGPGFTLDEDHFRLNTSGLLQAVRTLRCCRPG